MVIYCDYVFVFYWYDVYMIFVIFEGVECFIYCGIGYVVEMGIVFVINFGEVYMGLCVVDEGWCYCVSYMLVEFIYEFVSMIVGCL